MKHLLTLFRARRSQDRWWGDEKGIGFFEVVGIISVLTVVASGILMANAKNQGKNPIAGGAADQGKLQVCLGRFQEVQASLALAYPPGKDIPANDASLLFILTCQQDIERIVRENAALATDPKYKDFLTDLQKPITNIGQCSFSIAPGESTKPAGAKVVIGLNAIIPLSDPGDGVVGREKIVGTVTASTGETDVLTRTAYFKFDGTIFLDGTNKKAGDKVTLTLTPNGPVPVSCPPATFTWGEPIRPKILSFTLPAQVKSGESFSISWNTRDVDEGGVSLTGIGEGLSPSSFKLGVSITEDTPFTLTAKRGNLTDSQTKTVKVEQAGPSPMTYTVTLRTVDLATRVIDEFVSVTGTVTPVPPAGTSVTIGVNGTPVVTVPVEGNTFSSQVRLTHRTSASDLSLSSAGLTVRNCGNTSSPITLRNNNSSSGAGNVINAAVVAAGGGADSNIASLVVYHGVRVTSGEVNWSGCPAPTQFLPPGADIIGFNEQQTIGDVLCGTPCPGSGTFCTGTASITVDTTVGRVFTQSNWVVDIP